MNMKMLCAGLVLCLFLTAPGAAGAADPVAIEVHYQSGVKYFKRGLYDRAIQEFEKTLEMDPQHEEARAYLVQVRELQKTYRPAEARASEKAEIKKLYKEGRRLYRAQEYEKAIDVFNKILSLKPIDDFASYYRERSEVLLAAKIAREKKMEERQTRLEEKKRSRAARRKKREIPPSAKKEAVSAVAAALDNAGSAVLARERRDEEKLGLKEEKRTEARQRREAKLQAKEEQRQEKRRIKEDRRAEAQRRREVKEKAKEEKRQEKLARRKGRQRVRQEAVATAEGQREQAGESIRDKREARKNLREDRRQTKERFLEGVKAYGRKEYKTAIAAFKDVIKAEKKSGVLYTRSATRLLDKARKRLEGIGKDLTI